MGLLDDAIREHLELKRRHGADPQEVAREEDEALGPIGGHEPRSAPAHDDEHDDEFEFDEPIAPYEEPAAVVHEDQLELTDVDEEEAEEPAHELRAPERHEPEPRATERQHTIEYSIDDEHATEEPPAEPEPRAAEGRRRREPEPAEPEPQVLEPEPAEPADELEETPEFLQETPEHDRLWFEQKPPRDFDF